MMKLLEIVEQDILMDEMNELENEQVERILSNDCLIVENVLYGISRKKKYMMYFNTKRSF
jgi:hypothetical protein